MSRYRQGGPEGEAPWKEPAGAVAGRVIARLGTYARRGLSIVVGGLVITAALVACDEPPRPPPAPRAVPEEQRPTTSHYRVVEVEAPGSIAGHVRWLGPVPPVEPIEVRVHTDVCGESQPSLALRVSARGGVADTVLWLADVRAGLAADPPAQPPTMTVQGCRYVPHVLAIGVAWTIAFRNDDPVLHNVRAYRGEETIWDFALPERGSTESRVVQILGPLHVVSDVHAWMHAWVHAFPHPYFAVTGEDGRFRIQGVPPGQYVVRAWHEGWRIVGTRSGRPQYSRPVILARTISVSSRQETTVDFELSRESAEIAGEDDPL